jgi:hypothetical protein
MKNKTNISPQDEKFLDEVDAILGVTDDEEISSELDDCGVDPDAVRLELFQRIRRRATEKFTSRGEEIPPLMSDALRQLRPPSPEEQRTIDSNTAMSRVKDFLASLSAPASPSASFAPAFRNKAGEISKRDEEILREQQRLLEADAEKE